MVPISHDDVVQTSQNPHNRRALVKFAILSIIAAILTIALKMVAWLITDSVGLFSDAAESVVNLVAAVVALVVLLIAARPPDAEHQFGHSKAEYFSAVVEGTMIFVAAVVIIGSAIHRFFHLRELDELGIGLAVSVIASAINAGAAAILIHGGKKYRSITLRADGKHLLTDVWTTVGVLAAVGLVWLTGWLWLDPVIALIVGLNIVWTGWKLLRESMNGLMDGVLDPEYEQLFLTTLEEHRTPEVDFHGIRSRVSGSVNFVEFHIAVPGKWSVQRSHDCLEVLERDLHAKIPDLHISSHMEPREDPMSYRDMTPLGTNLDSPKKRLEESNLEE